MTKKISTEIAVGIILLFALFMGGIIWMENRGVEKNPMAVQPMEKIKASDQAIERSDIKDNLIWVGFPEPGEKVGGMINITGIARGSWYFEGEFPIDLIDEAGKKLASAPARAQGEWMKEDFIPFVTSFKYLASELMEAKLVLHRNNPSDLEDYQASVEIPVILEPEKTSAQIFFTSQYFDKNKSFCGQVFPAARAVSESMAYAREALEELLKGPTELEKKLGFTTAIPEGVKIINFDASEKIARIDLSEELLKLDADTECRRVLIQKQIEETVKNASEAGSVIITVAGKPFPGKFSSEGPGESEIWREKKE